MIPKKSKPSIDEFGFRSALGFRKRHSGLTCILYGTAVRLLSFRPGILIRHVALEFLILCNLPNFAYHMIPRPTMERSMTVCDENVGP